MGNIHLFAVIEPLSSVLSLIAVAVSIVSAYYAYWAHKTSWRFITIERHYDAFIEFGRLRVENWQMSHLFETSQNYERVKADVRSAFFALLPDRQHELRLKERACAAIIFTQYESTLYQLTLAKDSHDRGRTQFLNEVLDYLTQRLLRNPRLLYLWSEAGGNLRVFFEDATQRHYNDHIVKKLGTTISDNVDSVGPFGER